VFTLVVQFSWFVRFIQTKKENDTFSPDSLTFLTLNLIIQNKKTAFMYTYICDKTNRTSKTMCVGINPHVACSGGSTLNYTQGAHKNAY